MGEGLLSLSWNNHSSTFCHMLSTLRDVERYTDVTISCGGRFYPVHKLILSTCSDYFQKIFEATPCKHPVIVIKDVKYSDLESLLNYMYAGVVSVAQSDLAQLIKAAELLQVKGLAVPDEPPQTAKRDATTTDDLYNSPKRHKRNDDAEKNDQDEIEITHEIPGRSSERSARESREYEGERNTRENREYEGERGARESRVYEEERSTAESMDEAPTQDFPSAQVEAVVEDTLVKEEEVTEGSDSELGCGGFEYGSLGVPDKMGRVRDAMEPGEVGGYEGLSQEGYHHPHTEPEVHAGPSLLQGWQSLGELGEGPSTHGYSDDLGHQAYHHSLVGGNTEQQRTVEAENFGLGKIVGSVNPLRQFPQQQYSDCDDAYRSGTSGSLKKVKKPFSCAQCPYKTASKSNLVIHLRTHTGERPYKCSHCTFSASFEYNLKVHMRTHTGEKPFTCPSCPLRFAQKAHLKNHLFTHTGEKPFSCQHCNTKFSRMSNLRRHLQTHQ